MYENNIFMDGFVVRFESNLHADFVSARKNDER